MLPTRVTGGTDADGKSMGCNGTIGSISEAPPPPLPLKFGGFYLLQDGCSRA